MEDSDKLRANLKADLAELERLRDEIRVRMHLGGMDAKSAWHELEPRVDELQRRVAEEGQVAKQASLALVRELGEALRRFRDRLPKITLSDS